MTNPTDQALRPSSTPEAGSEPTSSVDHPNRGVTTHRDSTRTLDSFGHVAAGIARELGPRLTAIDIAADRLLRLIEEADRGEREVRTILDQSNRLGDVVRALLGVANPALPRFRSVDAGALMAQVTTVVQPEMSRGGIEVSIRCDGDCWVEGDPHQLREALLALLTNARLALDGWPGPRSVSASCTRDSGGHATMEVADSGPGIPSGQEERIFLPFVSGWGRQGMGLPLARLSLRGQGGELRLRRSGGGLGATFAMMLGPVHPER